MISNSAIKPSKPKKLQVPNIPKKHPLKQPFNILTSVANFLHFNTSYLNNNKLFAGCVMILLNVGSKFVTIQFSKSTEEYLKMSVTKTIMVFAMAWMGTRDIYAASILTTIFVVFSDYLLNEEHPMCIVPHKHRVLPKLKAIAEENGEHEVSPDELTAAIAVLEKAKKEKVKIHQDRLNNLYGEQGLE
jgi:hypothetical protein